jgi:hypothetical protein
MQCDFCGAERPHKSYRVYSHTLYKWLRCCADCYPALKVSIARRHLQKTLNGGSTNGTSQGQSRRKRGASN